MDRDGEFGEISRCRDGLWQLRHDPYDEDGETVYFLVAEENGKFRMVSAGQDPHDGCEDTP
jgi:putative component of toxin-antitoxin plasmid stabilization module